MEIKIVFEDGYLLVVEKPSGVVVNRAESVKGETIQDWAERKLSILNSQFPVNEANDFISRAGIVHRLDKETSGLLIIAKDPETFKLMQTQFKEREIEKRYFTLVHGQMPSISGEIKASVGRLPWSREKFGVLPGGKEAITLYKCESLYGSLGQEKYTLLTAFPHTGRTHQIRIHLKYIGHSIVGDNLYAGRKVYRRDQKFCGRLFLHAKYIKFMHPYRKETLVLESELPQDLQDTLSSLEKIKDYD
ncbi:MAG: RluA family pseudouridine synthase [Patescibacteria group bacterium]|nr:RluA family pseudouridine synthase [Patescibacteria group bacterium]